MIKSKIKTMKQNKLIGNCCFLLTKDITDLRLDDGELCLSTDKLCQNTIHSTNVHAYITIPYDVNNPLTHIKQADFVLSSHNTLMRVGKFNSKAGFDAHNPIPLKSDVDGSEYTFIGTSYVQYCEKVIATTDELYVSGEKMETKQPKGFSQYYSKQLPSISQDTLNLLPSLYKGEVIKVEVEIEECIKSGFYGDDFAPTIQKLKLTPNNELVVTPIEENIDVEKYISFREKFDDHLDWCIFRNDSKRTQEEWDEVKASDFYNRGIHLHFNNTKEVNINEQSNTDKEVIKELLEALSEITTLYKKEQSYFDFLKESEELEIKIQPLLNKYKNYL